MERGALLAALVLLAFAIPVSATEAQGPGPPTIRVRSPLGNSTWTRAWTYFVVWERASDGTAVPARLELCDAATGAAALQLAAEAPGPLFAWTVPATLATGEYFVRLRLAGGATARSDAFSINAGLVTVAEPLEGALCHRGEPCRVVWMYEGDMGYLDINLLTPDGQLVKNLANPAEINPPSFLWQVSTFEDRPGSYKIAVSYPLDPDVYAESEVFTIAGGVAITAPLYSTDIVLGDAVTVAWRLGPDAECPAVEDAQGRMLPGYDVFVSRDDPPFSATLAEAARGPSLVWSPPESASGEAVGPGVYRLTIWCTADGLVEGAVAIAIKLGSLKLKGVPRYVKPRETYPITWIARGDVQRVSIQLTNRRLRTRPPVVVASGAPNTGSFSWTVPPTLPPGDYSLRISSVRDPLVSDVSKSLVSLVTEPFDFLLPLPGAAIVRGTRLLVRWTALGNYPRVDVVLLERGTSPEDRGAEALPIALGAPNLRGTNQVEILVPPTIIPRDGYYVRLTPTDNPYDARYTPSFSIVKGELRLTSLEPPSSWLRGNRTRILWAGSPYPRISAFLEQVVSAPEGEGLQRPNVLTIAENVTNPWGLEWTVPLDAPIDSYRVRLVSATDPSVEAVAGPIALVGPRLLSVEPASISVREIRLAALTLTLRGADLPPNRADLLEVRVGHRAVDLTRTIRVSPDTIVLVGPRPLSVGTGAWPLSVLSASHGPAALPAALSFAPAVPLVTSLVIRVTLNISFESFESDFADALQQRLAAALGIDPARVLPLELLRGSAVLLLEVLDAERPSLSAAEARARLAGITEGPVPAAWQLQEALGGDLPLLSVAVTQDPALRGAAGPWLVVGLTVGGFTLVLAACAGFVAYHREAALEPLTRGAGASHAVVEYGARERDASGCRRGAARGCRRRPGPPGRVLAGSAGGGGAGRKARGEGRRVAPARRGRRMGRLSYAVDDEDEEEDDDDDEEEEDGARRSARHRRGPLGTHRGTVFPNLSGSEDEDEDEEDEDERGERRRAPRAGPRRGSAAQAPAPSGPGRRSTLAVQQRFAGGGGARPASASRRVGPAQPPAAASPRQAATSAVPGRPASASRRVAPEGSEGPPSSSARGPPALGQRGTPRRVFPDPSESPHQQHEQQPRPLSAQRGTPRRVFPDPAEIPPRNPPPNRVHPGAPSALPLATSSARHVHARALPAPAGARDPPQPVPNEGSGPGPGSASEGED
eukprot:tig00020516_g9967.t1